MAKLHKEVEVLSKKIQAAKQVSSKDMKDYLATASKVAKRVEAAKVVTGLISESLLGVVDNMLQIAIPLVSFSGDFELTGLLNSLKLWLSKKRAEQIAEDARLQQMRSISPDDSFGWGF